MRLRKHPIGWQAGATVAIERRYGNGDVAKMPSLAAEPVQLSPAVICVSSSRDAIVLRKLTKSIPMVICVATDPIGSGLIASYARPGGNVTGLVWDQGQGVTDEI